MTSADRALRIVLHLCSDAWKQTGRAKAKTMALRGPANPKTTVESEYELIKRAQRGEETAFEALFETYKRRVYALCYRLTASAADAEDLTQEAFLKLFRKISSFRGESSFYTWLHRLVMNEGLMYVRKKRVPQVPLEEIQPWREEPVMRDPGRRDRRLSSCLDRITLNRAIAQLPPGYRAAFLLYDVEGYRHGEIAQMMKWSLGNSKSQVFKARRKMRSLLAQGRWKGFGRRPLAGAA